MDVTTLQNLCEGVMPETEQGRTLEQAVLEVLNAQVRMVNLMTADVTRNSENKLEVRAVLNKESESVLFECVLQSNLEAMQKGQEHFLSNIEEALRKKRGYCSALPEMRKEKGC